MDLKLSGKVAVVTGGSGGLGRAIAVALASEGMRLVLAGRDLRKLNQTTEAISRASATAAHMVVHDLTEPTAAAACVEDALRACGSIDLLVNCAGATKRGDFLELTDDDWADGFSLKFHGTTRMCRAAWPHLMERQGSIINIVGVGSRTPSSDFLIGGSVNSALLNFTKGLADRGIADGVRVNAINPGFFATDRTEKRIAGVMTTAGVSRDEAVADVLRTLRVRRLGRPEEVGQLAAYLASEQAAYFQGAVLDIDGGVTRGL